jgi:hypothetical protein
VRGHRLYLPSFRSCCPSLRLSRVGRSVRPGPYRRQLSASKQGNRRGQENSRLGRTQGAMGEPPYSTGLNAVRSRLISSTGGSSMLVAWSTVAPEALHVTEGIPIIENTAYYSSRISAHIRRAGLAGKRDRSNPINHVEHETERRCPMPSITVGIRSLRRQKAALRIADSATSIECFDFGRDDTRSGSLPKLALPRKRLSSWKSSSRTPATKVSQRRSSSLPSAAPSLR